MSMFYEFAQSVKLTQSEVDVFAGMSVWARKYVAWLEERAAKSAESAPKDAEHAEPAMPGICPQCGGYGECTSARPGVESCYEFSPAQQAGRP